VRPKLLIDENLSPSLARIAAERGDQAAHLRDVGLLRAKDWALLRFVLDHDWTLVTNNVEEFRRRYQQAAPVHAGLVCLEAVALGRAIQQTAFSHVLDELDDDGDMVNQEMVVDAAQSPPRVSRRSLP
jgi:predicted nuclease of predicted toxin-antitoxin system